MRAMKICIIYHSYSGITKGVAERVRDACGGDLVEVTPKEPYSTFSAYTRGCRRAMKKKADAVEPETIDVSAYDLIVVGTPIWAWKATPVINGGIAALEGCAGKKAVVYATCGAKYGSSLVDMKEALMQKGVKVTGEIGLTRKEINEQTRVNDLIALVRAADATG